MNLLMSVDNPSGYKLEELLELIIQDINLKTKRIEDEVGGVAAIVRVNNNAIVRKLQDAIVLQNRTMEALDELGENKGVSSPRLPTTNELLSVIIDYIEDNYNAAIQKDVPVSNIVSDLQKELNWIYPRYLIKLVVTSVVIDINDSVDCVKYSLTIQDKPTSALLMSGERTYNHSQN